MSSSLADEILGNVCNPQSGPRSWFERLPADVQRELDAVRQTFDPTRHQKRAFARAIIAAAEARGWPIAKEKQVVTWLDQR